MKRSISLLLVLMLAVSLLSGCDTEKEPVAFTTDLRAGAPAYADVVSIEPVYRVGENQFSYTHTACRCETTDGETIWIYMETAQYNEHLNQVNFKALEWSAEKVTFAQPLRFHGTAKKADGLCDGLSKRTKSEIVLLYESVDPEEADAAMGRNLTETAFSSSSASLAPVYADITAIVPAYEINSNLGITQEAFICEALDTDGNTLWIYVNYQEYISIFDASLLLTGPLDDGYNPIYYDTPVRIHGTARRADDLFNSVEDSGIDMLLDFKSKD